MSIETADRTNCSWKKGKKKLMKWDKTENKAPRLTKTRKIINEDHKKDPNPTPGTKLSPTITNVINTIPEETRMKIQAPTTRTVTIVRKVSCL